MKIRTIKPLYSWYGTFASIPWYKIHTNSSSSRLAPNQWETSLQSNAVSHWLGTNLEPALYESIYSNLNITSVVVSVLAIPASAWWHGSHCWYWSLKHIGINRTLIGFRVSMHVWYCPKYRTTEMWPWNCFTNELWTINANFAKSDFFKFKTWLIWTRCVMSFSWTLYKTVIHFAKFSELIMIWSDSYVD